MGRDYRADFIEKSKKLADGEVIEDDQLSGEILLDADDPRKRFILSSEALGNGKSMADVRKMHTDALALSDKNLDPREKFARRSQLMFAPESVYDMDLGRSDNEKSSPSIRADAMRIGTGIIFPRTNKNDRLDDDDLRNKLLKKLAAI